MKVLIVGLGSIAHKHIKALKLIDEQTEIFALRSGQSGKETNGVVSIYDKSEIPDDISFIIVSNPTSEHYTTISELMHLRVPMFIEKPPLSSIYNSMDLANSLKKFGVNTYVAFNMRFHPLIKKLKEEFLSRKPLELSVYCGSYLPDWRPHEDYRKNYSAKNNSGGGVHLDLIHELDYTMFLLGNPKNVEKYLSKKSSLEIDSYDVAHYTMEYERTSVFITLNYYRPEPKRCIECIWSDEIWKVDLLKGSIQSNKMGTVFQCDFNIFDTYLEQMQYFLNNMHNQDNLKSSFEESLEVLNICLTK